MNQHNVTFKFGVDTMEKTIELVSSFLDQLYFSFINPFFYFLGQGLEYLIIKPLDFFHFQPVSKIIVVAILTALLSLFLRRLFKVDKKERNFKKIFTEKKKKQQDFSLITDWKSKEAFYRASDNDIDEDFNTYLAGRYASYVAVYMLPIFLAMHWLGIIFNEARFVMDLPANAFGLEGLSISLVFLTTYLTALITFYFVSKIPKNKAAYN